MKKDNNQYKNGLNTELNEEALKKKEKKSSGSFKKRISTRQAKNGAVMTASTCIIIAIIFVLNLILGKLDIKFDLTKDKIYSLSEQTSKILDNLEYDISIISLEGESYSNDMVTNILEKYEKASDKIQVNTVDPIVNPNFTKEYTEDGESITIGCVIVESGDKYKVLDPFDMYEVDYYQGGVTGIKVEQALTSAIQYVTDDELPNAYVLQGHSEMELPYHIEDALKNENYKVNDLNLLSGQTWEYSDSDVVIINNPQRDLSNEELDILMEFFGEGGNALIIMNYMNEELVNFTKLFEHYGIKVEEDIVFEGDTSMMYGVPTNIIPYIMHHEVTEPLITAKLPVLAPVSQGIIINDLTRSSLNIAPLLTTSDDSYGKDEKEITSFEKQEGDAEGPFNLAVAITEMVDEVEEKETNIVVVGSSEILNSQTINLTKGGNLDFIMNSMNWMTEKEEGISIRAKDISAQQIMVQEDQVLLLALISMLLIPMSVFVMGGIVSYRRKRL